MAFDHGPVVTPRLRFVRFGRKATKHVRTLFDRLWLKAAVRRIANFVGFGLNSGRNRAKSGRRLEFGCGSRELRSLRGILSQHLLHRGR